MAGEEKKISPSKPAPKKAAKEQNRLLKSIKKWFREMRSELKKVIWSTPRQVMNNTLIVLAMIVLASVVVWGFDSMAGYAIKALITVAG